MALFLPIALFAFELSVQTGKEENQEYSLLHIKDTEPFLCEAQYSDLHEVTSVACLFLQRPLQSFAPIENSFFHVDAKIDGKEFKVIIKPKKSVLLRAQHFNLLQDREIYHAQEMRSGHWLVIGYHQEPPLLTSNERQQSALNLPVVFPKQPLPYVGGLDMHGNPIHMTRVKDVSDYLIIKQAYENRDYDKVLATIDSVLQEFPNTIFKSEMLLYRLRAYHETGENEPVITIGKQFIREFSSDLNIAEVLAAIANAYSKIAMYTDADYFFDRLFDEHPQSEFARMGLIYKGDQLSGAGNGKKAISFYERALYETQSKKTASIAAYKLAQYYMELGQSAKAAEYVTMILDGYAEQFSDHREEAIAMAHQFADTGAYAIAARLLGSILERMERGDDGFEQMLKDRGIWLAQTDQKEQALESFNDYLEKFRFGEYVDEIKRQRDGLFFDVTEMNASDRLREYDGLIAKYQGDSIGDRAYYEKAKLLSELSRYDEILTIEKPLMSLDEASYPKAGEMVDTAVFGLMRRALEQKSCERVIELSQGYDVNLSREWDDDLFECYIAAGSFERAKRLAQQHLQAQDSDERTAWLERYVVIDFSLGNYTAVLDALEELLSIHTKNDVKRAELYRRYFDASQRLGDHDRMLEAMVAIESIDGVVFKDIERYTQMMTHAKSQKNSVMVENFGKKVVKLQQAAGSYTQSPYVEFTLAQTLIELDKSQEAYDLLQTLEARPIQTEQRSRQHYMLGTLYQKRGDRDAARSAYEKSQSEDPQGVWGKLASDALGLMQ
ncbi:MAG: hypothetical protein JXK05_06285 [Campylobacterales bacterium]|nr:hypothetical protein [Campylobacterales bacterium]